MAPQPPPLTPVLFLSLFILPFSIWLAGALSIYLQLRTYFKYQNWPSSELAVRKRMLLTGDDDGAVLSTARVLRASGSSVYVVKQERIPYMNAIRTSKAVHKYIGLASGRLTPLLRRLTKGRRFHVGIPANLPGSILNLIETEKIDVWMHCDAARPTIPQLQAKEIVLKHTTTKLYEPDFESARLTRSFGFFAHHLKQHETEIRCPKTVIVRSRAEIHDLLWKAPAGQKFLLERRATQDTAIVKANSGSKRDSGFDDSQTLVGNSSDSDDFDGAETSTPIDESTQLPFAHPNETYSTVASIQISPKSPWIMHEVIYGKPGVVSVLVAAGKVTAFTARIGTHERVFSTATARNPWSSRGSARDIRDWQKHEEMGFVDAQSTIGMALLGYAQRFARSLAGKPSTYLNLNFFLTDRSTASGAEQKIVATGCDFEFTPVLVQQALAGGVADKLGRAMTCANASLEMEDEVVLLPVPSTAAVSRGPPPLKLPRASSSSGESLNQLASSLEELINEQDTRFDRGDLVPWIWFWLVQGPIEVVFEGLVETLENAQARVSRTGRLQKWL